MTELVLPPLTNNQLKELEKLDGLQPRGSTLPTDPSSIQSDGTVADIGLNVERQPSRVTGAVDTSNLTAEQLRSLEDPNKLQKFSQGASDFIEDTGLGAIARGFNEFLFTMTKPVELAIAKGIEAAGLAEPGTVDRDSLMRLFNSNDFEKQKIIIPYVLTYGAGDFIGATDKEGFAETYMRPAGEVVAGTVPFLGLQGKAAQLSTQVPKVATGMQTTAEGVRQAMLAPFVSKPATTVAAETAIAGLSGASLPIEEEIFGTQTGLLVPGALVGGSLAFTGATKGPIGRIITWGAEKFGTGRDDLRVATGKTDPSAGTRGAEAKGELGRAIQVAAGTETGEANVAIAKQIEETLTPFAEAPIQLSPAEQTLDATLLATQRRVEKSGDQAFTIANRNRKYNILQAAENFLNSNFRGSVIADAPLWVVDEASGAYVPMVRSLDEEAADLVDTWAALTTSDTTGVLPKLTDRAPTGQDIRSAVIQGHQAAKEAAEKLAKKLNINDADQFTSRDAFKAAQDNLRETVLTRQGEQALSYKALPQAIKDFIEAPIDRVTFQDWKLYRDQVGSAIGVAKNKTEIRQLYQLAKTLDDLGEAFGRTNDKFRQFQDVYNATVVTPYERSGVLRVMARGPGGTKESPVYILPDEKVADAFLTNPDTARQYTTLFSNDTARMDAMKNVVLDKVRSLAYSPSKGQFKPDAINTYVNKNREILTELGLIDDLTNTETLLRDTLARNAELTQRKRIVDGNQVLRAITRAENVGDPNKLIDDALKNPSIMRDLRQVVRDKFKGDELADAEMALRTAVMDRIFAQAPDGLENPGKFKQVLFRNERSLANLMDQSHLKSLYQIAEAAERVYATPMPSGAALTPEGVLNRLEDLTGTSVRGQTTLARAAMEGRISNLSAATYILTRAAATRSSVRSDALFKEAMFNPELARTLTTETNLPPGQIPAQTKSKLNAYLFGIGAAYGFESPDIEPITVRIETPEKPIEKPTKNELPQLDFKLFQEEMPVPPFNENQPKLQPVDNSTSIIEKINAPPMPKNTQPQIDARTLFPNDPLAGAIQQAQANTGIMSLPRRA